MSFEMNNKRKRAFLDDDADNFIRKMPKTFNIVINTKEYKSQALCEERTKIPRDHDCASVIIISDDDSSTQERKSHLDNHNAAIRNENQDKDIDDETSASAIIPTENPVFPSTCSAETIESSYECVELLCLTHKTRAHFVKKSSTRKLESHNRTNLENYDADDENSSSANIEHAEKSVFKKCINLAESLEIYVEHKVPVRNVDYCDKSMDKVIAWDCDPASNVSYDWSKMDK
ncbi:uncharacterized protein LOC132947420 [Metopolophium dirhodum]|uniref:uncharacterized protein LOC132947420 n=1 Tax=Metopolophium dirhodum TaxID=44670 RepID=UPI00298F873C|nr:uncharacterized protein LOC132947420 [Metopolophium dirhodum]XP_060873681.1 uncharacterized protein LOC132947420 [Metopolophium dirhodum]